MSATDGRGNPGDAGAGALLALSRTLREEGRPRDALVIVDHLLNLVSDDERLLFERVSALQAAGDTMAVLLTLRGIQKRAEARGELEASWSRIREQALPAITVFNAHLNAGEVETAVAYAEVLAELVPQSLPIVEAAMNCNLALGRLEQVRRYARELLTLNANHGAALEALAGTETADLVAAKVAEALTSTEAHPLFHLRNLHDAAGMILRKPIDPAAEDQLERLLTATRDFAVRMPDGTEKQAWEKHYRLLMQAVDLEAIRQPAPEPLPASPMSFMNSAGEPLSAGSMREQADRLGARAVFFVAADARYVELYARWYVLSVLRYCDVDCLILVHVIGGEGRLSEAVAAVGVQDPRLVFSAEPFDAGAAVTRCWDAPPAGLSSRPIAHLQSVRFQRLGDILALLGRPVFVSDIDLLLQRGVADLLDRTEGADVVFNENTVAESLGDRLTANLLLIYPTPAGATLARFLRAYLDAALTGTEVTRWIDQAALLLGRQHLARHAPAATVAYFDPGMDINNVVYTTYQEHPYRFLSLYHGFDTSSLEGDSRVLG